MRSGPTPTAAADANVDPTRQRLEHGAETRNTPLVAFVALISVVGTGVLCTLVAFGWARLRHAPGAFWILSGLLLLGELRTIRYRGRRTVGEITTSTTFAFALLLGFGTTLAVVAQSAASIISDATLRKPLVKALFNAAQYTLSLAAAGGAIRLLTGAEPLISGARFAAADLVPFLLGMVAFFLVNNFLIAVVVGLDQGVSIARHVRRELPFHAATDVVLMGLSPVVVVVVQRSPILTPLFLLPMAAVYVGAGISLAKEHQSLHDALTGLPNRTMFRFNVEEVLEEGDHENRQYAVLLIDLDHFREINDTLGHHTGDLILKELGPRLKTTVRAGDVVARFGGDEFALFLPDVAGVGAATNVAARIGAVLEEPFTVEGLRLEIEASIGVALFPDHGSDVDALLQKADVAMYMAKESRTGWELYSPERDQHSVRRLALLGDLRTAITRSELVLQYQPKADLEDGRVVGVEALVRWAHPELGMVPPGDFVPLAERSGLIGPLTMYVLEEAMTQSRRWEAEGIRLRVAVNLSARNLHDPSLPSGIGELLERTGMSAEWLDLEITESTIMTDSQRALGVLTKLSEMGLRIAIDDFGTGYSSLAYLSRFPVSELKIDRALIVNIERSEHDAVIVRSTADLARALGLTVVAEGVETAQVWAALQRLGCDLAQGYYVSPPVPADTLTSWLKEGRWPTAAARPLRPGPITWANGGTAGVEETVSERRPATAPAGEERDA